MIGDLPPGDAAAVQLPLHEIESGRFHSLAVNGDPVE